MKKTKPNIPKTRKQLRKEKRNLKKIRRSDYHSKRKNQLAIENSSVQKLSKKPAAKAEKMVFKAATEKTKPSTHKDQVNKLF